MTKVVKLECLKPFQMRIPEMMDICLKKPDISMDQNSTYERLGEGERWEMS